MAKLTLNVDEHVVARAKRYAARSGISVSRLVEQLLALVSRSTAKESDDPPPILERLQAQLKGASADRSDYKKYLERKYR